MGKEKFSVFLWKKDQILHNGLWEKNLYFQCFDISFHKKIVYVFYYFKKIRLFFSFRKQNRKISAKKRKDREPYAEVLL